MHTRHVKSTFLRFCDTFLLGFRHKEIKSAKAYAVFISRAACTLITTQTCSRHLYLEAIDLIINTIEDEFDLPDFKIYSVLTSLLVRSVKGEDIQDTLKVFVHIMMMILIRASCVHSYVYRDY